MKNGKISQTVLNRSVWKQLNSSNALTSQTAGPGHDYASVQIETGKDGERVEFITASASTVAGSVNLAARTICTAVNNVAVSGADPVGVQICLCVPTSASESEIREVMRDVDDVCAEEGIRVLGGHTQASRRVKEVMLSVSAEGVIPAGRKRISSSGARPGMDLILTKWIGLEGTALLAQEKEDVLLQRFSRPFLEKAKEFSKWNSIRKEAAVAAGAGAAAMHDASEGGIFGALWEFAESSGIGLEVDLKKIPIRQETVEITEIFGVNPYKLLSGGSLLIAAADGNAVKRELEKAGIPAAVIGKAVEGNDRILLHDGEQRFLETVQTDEIFKVLEE